MSVTFPCYPWHHLEKDLIPKLKQMSKKEKYDCCPYCGSTEGFKLTYVITGNGSETRKFTGEIIDSEKNENHDVDSSVRCLTCKKIMPTETVRTSE